MMRNYVSHCSVAVALLIATLSPSVLTAQEPAIEVDEICSYPLVDARDPFAALDPGRLSTANEVEPNNDRMSAQELPLGFGAGQDHDVDITGAEIKFFDKDYYSFKARRGETLGVAVLAIDVQRVNSIVAVVNAAGKTLIENRSHGGLAGLYPPESEFPAGGLRGDSALTFAIPADGEYFVRVKGFGASTGGYAMQVRLRKPPNASLPVGSVQKVFLDFDGETVNAQALFGDGGKPIAKLSRFSTFLQRWGLAANREVPLTKEITKLVRGHFAELTAGTDAKIEIISSGAGVTDPFGDPLVSRVIVGGSITELGISTIGIAEFIDPANYSTDDTAVVLLDLLSAPATSPNYPNSVLSLTRDRSISVEQAVAHVIAAVISHEICHFLGCWHTDNTNDKPSIIDQGGRLNNLAGVGDDGILGTGDDHSIIFHDDHYAREGVADISSIQNVRARVIAALTPGQVPTGNMEAPNQLDLAIAAFNALSHTTGNNLDTNDVRRLIGVPVTNVSTAGSSVNARTPQNRFQAAAAALKARLKAYSVD